MEAYGSRHDALWSLDHKGGIEKAYCCFNTNARDFARIGNLMLHNGNWKGRQLVPEEYIKEALQPVGLPDETGMATNYYGYQWWLMPNVEMFFMHVALTGSGSFAFLISIW